ncbi:hypothetical protein LTR20_009222 [Exophiala xenobiotica]|nr:hypothetical protein LTR40_012110 [Exophiala xenobiotica]KAK5367679.1 hypothetical protein LTS13_007609 [Exophiala xenobiotica]KAK5397838.1 hypothetical protein LTR79_005353 [Exophiala xenobiotica]KAK5421065.1 hypothetical protein LTR90_002552 [Exophiala xenobiotica]KAK5456805.1 hypothetical protein LTR20_009222 [Exophiala xenobiotica]
MAIAIVTTSPLLLKMLLLIMSKSAPVVMATGALMAGSTNVGEFIVWRFFAGAGTWMMLSAVPIWMTEVVPPAIRGILVDIHGACLLFGYACASWCGYGFYWVDNKNAWRGPFGK